MGTLYVVATPIGNLNDISPRAIETLKAANIVAAEDTRHSLGLLNHFDIQTKLVSYHKFNEKSRVDELLQALSDGACVALISDAGTPAISDPGSILVSGAIAAGYQVVGVCGPCAAITAASISGFTLERFTFYGFFPRENKQKRALMESIALDSAMVGIFYESPFRIMDALRDLGAAFLGAQFCVCNDLSKKFEKTYYGTAEQILHALAQNENAQKGEYTIVMQKPAAQPQTAVAPSALSLEAQLVEHMIKNDVDIKQAVSALSQMDSYSKKELYRAGLSLKELLLSDEE